MSRLDTSANFDLYSPKCNCACTCSSWLFVPNLKKFLLGVTEMSLDWDRPTQKHGACDRSCRQRRDKLHSHPGMIIPKVIIRSDWTCLKFFLDVSPPVQKASSVVANWGEVAGLCLHLCPSISGCVCLQTHMSNHCHLKLDLSSPHALKPGWLKINDR